jgi:hypothetical protein
MATLSFPRSRRLQSVEVSAVAKAVWAPALVLLTLYGLWLAAVFASGHDVRDFIHMGDRYVFVRHHPPLFRPDPRYLYARTNGGYDGQFAYYIAVDPINARFHVDQVNYRYTRIVYPMLARLLSFGQFGLIPYMLVLINWLALAGGTLALSAWLARKRLSPWLALIYGLSPGLFICLHMDLVEPLAFGLVALGVFLYSGSGNRRFVWSGLAFALAVLTRESTAVFPAVIAIWILYEDRHRWTDVGVLLGLTFLPFALYKVFLLHWLGRGASMVPYALLPEPIPFAGLFSYWPWSSVRVEVVVAVVVPALICSAIGAWTVRARQAGVEVWLLLANVVLFVVTLNHLTYGNVVSTARVTTGVVLAAILCLPAFDRVTSHGRTWLWICAALWFSAFPSVVTFAGRLPTSSDLLIDFSAVLALFALTQGWVVAARPAARRGRSAGRSRRARASRPHSLPRPEPLSHVPAILQGRRRTEQEADGFPQVQ